MRTIYINGKVYTGELPLQEAVVVEQDRFLFAGDTAKALAYRLEDTKTVDLNGAFVCPGFNDSHMHLVNYGYSLEVVDLAKATDSMEHLKNRVKDFIFENGIKPGEWVCGRGWNHDFFADGVRFPNRHDLDEISTEHPICLTRACGHACVVNSRALEEAGITGDTTKVEGGIVETDENGEPTGVFRENAMGLIYDRMPQHSCEDIKRMILLASKELNSYGITSSQTDDLPVFSNVPYTTILQAYEELVKEGKMTVRVNEQAQFMSFEELKGFVEKGYHSGFGDEWFRIGPLKMLGDGSLGARSAYMSEPYADDSSTRGIPIYTGEQFLKYIEYAHTHDMYVAIHAIGDGILDEILEAYETVLKKYPKKDHRHGVVHCQIMRPEQAEKFKELQLHAYIQPIFLDYDIHIVEERVGSERAATSYVFHTLYDTVHTSSGSDCPVELPDVMAGIQCAVTRRTLDGTGPYLPGEALTVQQAIDTFTKEGAHASFEENTKGTIKPGMLADFVILEKNPFEEQPEHLRNIRVLETFTGGKSVYRREEK